MEAFVNTFWAVYCIYPLKMEVHNNEIEIPPITFVNYTTYKILKYESSKIIVKIYKRLCFLPMQYHVEKK